MDGAARAIERVRAALRATAAEPNTLCGIGSCRVVVRDRAMGPSPPVSSRYYALMCTALTETESLKRNK